MWTLDTHAAPQRSRAGHHWPCCHRRLFQGRFQCRAVVRLNCALLQQCVPSGQHGQRRRGGGHAQAICSCYRHVPCRQLPCSQRRVQRRCICTCGCRGEVRRVSGVGVAWWVPGWVLVVKVAPCLRPARGGRYKLAWKPHLLATRPHPRTPLSYERPAYIPVHGCINTDDNHAACVCGAVGASPGTSTTCSSRSTFWSWSPSCCGSDRPLPPPPVVGGPPGVALPVEAAVEERRLQGRAVAGPVGRRRGRVRRTFPEHASHSLSTRHM